MARQVQKVVADTIRAGCVVMAHKTKLAHEGGRQLVSVGPYKKAVQARRSFALITKGDQSEYISAITAAQEFVDFVGRNNAWDAVQQARAKCRLR
jgi:hypothetical protein